MKQIPLTKGLFTVVDDKDFSKFAIFRWYAEKHSHGHYARRRNEKKKLVYLHRIIMNANRNQIVDHKNRNTLDNRKSNLRFCSPSQSSQNKKQTGGSSKYKGVSWDKFNRKWKAQIQKNDKNFNIGRYTSEKKAALEYDKKAKELFGEFAVLNF